MAYLKSVYGAATYPQILKSWDKNWAGLSTYFKYPQEGRKYSIYTDYYTP